MACVYQHIRLDINTVFYIGIGNNSSRAFVQTGRNNYWKSIVKKAGYKVEILFDNLTWEEACGKEVELIAKYGRRDLGTGILCNMTDGGLGGFGSVQKAEKRKFLQKVMPPKVEPYPKKKMVVVTDKEIDLGSFRYRPKFRLLIRDGQMQILSPKANELLFILTEHVNDLLPREVALKKIWGSDTYLDDRNMDVNITKLRKYLSPDKNVEISNIRGKGLRLIAPSYGWN